MPSNIAEIEQHSSTTTERATIPFGTKMIKRRFGS
jgi:hypothetical protein